MPIDVYVWITSHAEEIEITPQITDTGHIPLPVFPEIMFDRK